MLVCWTLEKLCITTSVPAVPLLITMFGTTLWHHCSSLTLMQIMPPSPTQQLPTPQNITEVCLSCWMQVSICMQEKRKNISWAPWLSSLIWNLWRFGGGSFMYLASGGYSKMSGFNAHILLRGPQSFLEQRSSMFLVPATSATYSVVVHPFMQQAFLREYTVSYICIACQYKPTFPSLVNKVVCYTAVTTLRKQKSKPILLI